MTVGHLISVPVPQVGAKERKSNKTLSRDELGLCYSYGEKADFSRICKGVS